MQAAGSSCPLSRQSAADINPTLSGICQVECKLGPACSLVGLRSVVRHLAQGKCPRQCVSKPLLPVCAACNVQGLARGYWPSYNVAYFPNIYEWAGYPNIIQMSQEKGKEYDQPTRWLMYQV
eukprot:GHRR01037481.1.p2 GENE.GHRR01037481.1~~GHRR01037481.1.p2  ORF type:complete len:122 (-),score=21.11 GHRR01037481.1:214-579(-)